MSMKKVFSKEKLVSQRKKKHMTQMDLASAMDVSRALVSSWENGKAIPNDSNLQQLRVILGEEVVEKEKKDIPWITYLRNHISPLTVYHCIIIAVLFWFECRLYPKGQIPALTIYLYAKREKLPVWFQLIMIGVLVFEFSTLYFHLRPVVPVGWIELPQERIYPQ